MFGDLAPLDSQLAVVPIVVNAGAALLPAILAFITSCVAILFKPKELIRVCRAKPWIPVLMLVIVGGTVGLIWLWPSPVQPGSGSRRRAGAEQGVVTIDWTKIALARIEAMKQQALRAVVIETQETTPVVIPDTQATASENAFIFRVGPRRLGAIGADLAGPLQKTWHYYPRWTDETGVEQEDTEAMILSSPAFYNGRVYGASCLLDPPDNYGAVFCLDAQTGRQIWSLDAIGDNDLTGFFSSPALTADGRYLIIGQGLHPDSDCHLICIDTEAGKIHWTLQVALHIESSPAIDRDTVYVGCGAIEDPSTHKPMSHPGFVLAVGISDGEERWRYDVADPESSPVVQDGVLYIGSGFNGQAVVALDTQTDQQDRLLWRTPTPYPITGAVTLLGDRVIAGGGNGDFVYRDPNPAGVVLALDKATGRIQWSTDLPDAVLGAVAAGSSLICPVASGEVVALDPSNGKQQWATAVSGHAPVLAACTVTEQAVYAVSQDGYLARLDYTTGKLKDKQYINATERPGEQGLCISSPLVVNGLLFVGSETGGLRCYQGSTP
jgi:outer membrane protein assembly factor BamB